MQGFERVDRQLTDVAALAGHLIPAGSMFAFLAEHRAEVFPDADYAGLFAPPGSGRPSALPVKSSRQEMMRSPHHLLPPLRPPAIDGSVPQKPVPKSWRGTVASTCCW
jgi:hypothetical protein